MWFARATAHEDEATSVQVGVEVEVVVVVVMMMLNDDADDNRDGDDDDDDELLCQHCLSCRRRASSGTCLPTSSQTWSTTTSLTL